MCPEQWWRRIIATRVSRHVLIKKYLIRFFHIVPLIYMIDVCTLSNKCFWILNLEYDYREVSNIRRKISMQLNRWSLRCSWSIACRCCSNYIFIFYLTPGFNRLGKDCCGHQIGLIYFIQYFQLVFLWNAFGRPTGVFHGRFTWYLNGILEFCICLVMTWFAVLIFI